MSSLVIILKLLVLYEVLNYDARKNHTKKYYNVFRFIVTVGSILLPALLSIGQMDPNKLPKNFVIKPIDLCDSAGVYLFKNNINIKTQEPLDKRKIINELFKLRSQVNSEYYMTEHMYNGAIPYTGYIAEELTAAYEIYNGSSTTEDVNTTLKYHYGVRGKTKEIDMTKVFGIDRNVITPDNNNVEATFLTAKQIGAGGSKFVQSSLNFKEQ